MMGIGYIPNIPIRVDLFHKKKLRKFHNCLNSQNKELML